MEKLKHPGICHYYSAAILYYKEEYVHALGHLEEALELRGFVS